MFSLGSIPRHESKTRDGPRLWADALSLPNIFRRLAIEWQAGNDAIAAIPQIPLDDVTRRPPSRAGQPPSVLIGQHEGYFEDDLVTGDLAIVDRYFLFLDPCSFD